MIAKEATKEEILLKIKGKLALSQNETIYRKIEELDSKNLANVFWASGSEIDALEKICDLVCYPKSRLKAIKTSSGRILAEALLNHPQAPKPKKISLSGTYYLGKDLINFYEKIDADDRPGLPPWLAASDQQAEHADIVARIMNELEPHISAAIRKVLFEEENHAS